MSEEQDQPEVEKSPVLEYRAPSTATPRWKAVWTAPSAQEAHMVVMRLQSMGLHARVDGENMAPLGGIGGPSNLLAARVHVFEDEVATAWQVIEEIEARRKARRDSRIVHCSACDVPAKSVLHPLRKTGLALIALGISACAIGSMIEMNELAIGFFFLIPVGVAMLIWSVTPRWICPKCGKRWAEREPEDDLEDDEDSQEDDDD